MRKVTAGYVVCRAKMARVQRRVTESTMEKSLLVCAFGYSEKPIMSMEGMSDVRE